MIIVICDDDRKELEEIQRICQQCCNAEDKIITYSDSTELYKWLMMENWNVDLFILDIEMPKMSGLELKQQISKMCIDTHILFVTSHSEVMGNAFGKYVIGFVDKKDYEGRIRQSLREVREEIGKESTIQVEDTNGIHIFRPKEIVKIEAQHVYTRVERILYYDFDKESFKTEIKEYRISLGKWAKCLDSVEFYQINRSLIINFHYVERYNNMNELEFINGEKYAVPIKKRKAVKIAYNQYCIRKARYM